MIRAPLCVLALTAQEQEEHGEEDEEEVEELGFEVLLMKDHGAEEEADNDGTSTHHGDDGDHGAIQSEGIEVGEVGGGEEDADEDDAPVPMERGGLLVGGPPEEEEHGEHHEELVDVVPRLHSELVKSHATVLRRCHEEFVVESGDGAEHVGEHHEDNPFVVLEVDALFLAGAREHVESDHGDDDTNPLPEVEPFGEEGEGSDEHHDGTGGVDGSDDGDGQVLESEVGEEPAAEHDAGLEEDVFMFCPAVLVGVEEAVLGDVSLCREDDEGEKDEGGEEGVEQQDGNDGICPERLLLEDVVEAEEEGREEC